MTHNDTGNDTHNVTVTLVNSGDQLEFTSIWDQGVLDQEFKEFTRTPSWDPEVRDSKSEISNKFSVNQFVCCELHWEVLVLSFQELGFVKKIVNVVTGKFV